MILNLEIGKDNKILRTKSQDVADFGDPKIQKLIANMEETLASIKEGVGLAAPQIGENIRIFILSPEISKQLIFINPTIKKSLKKNKLQEGCLSLPNLSGIIKRSTNVKIQAYDETGKKFSLTATGLLAQAVQHEIDHLDGVLFIDKAMEIFTAPKIKD